MTFLLTWTDLNNITHTGQLPMSDASSLTVPGGVFHFQTTLTNAWASGDFNIYIASSSPIQYATGYTACPFGSGTGQYDLFATVMQLQ